MISENYLGVWSFGELPIISIALSCLLLFPMDNDTWWYRWTCLLFIYPNTREHVCAHIDTHSHCLFTCPKMHKLKLVFSVLNYILFPCVNVVPIMVLQLRFHMTRCQVSCVLRKLSVSMLWLWISFVIKFMLYAVSIKPYCNSFFVTAKKLPFCNLTFTFEKVPRVLQCQRCKWQSKKWP